MGMPPPWFNTRGDKPHGHYDVSQPVKERGLISISLLFLPLFSFFSFYFLIYGGVDFSSDGSGRRC